MLLLKDINILRKDEVNIILQREMYEKLISWTKLRLGNASHGRDDDELMETTDVRD